MDVPALELAPGEPAVPDAEVPYSYPELETPAAVLVVDADTPILCTALETPAAVSVPGVVPLPDAELYMELCWIGELKVDEMPPVVIDDTAIDDTALDAVLGEAWDAATDCEDETD